jgi:hypothetical protein
MSAVMKVTPTREARSDTATRDFDVDNAPVLEYSKTTGHYRRTQDLHIRWQPTHVQLAWDCGVLKLARVRGLRLKKNGDLGMLNESEVYQIKGGKVQPLASREQYPTEWVQSIVDLFGEVPELVATKPEEDARYSYSRSRACKLTEATVVV